MAVWVTDSATASSCCGWSSPALFKSDSTTVEWDCAWTFVDLSSYRFFFTGCFSGCSPLLSWFRQLTYRFLFWRESWAHSSLVKVRTSNVNFCFCVLGWIEACCSSSASCSRLSIMSAFCFCGVWSVRLTQADLSAILLVDLLRPYGLVFPFAAVEYSWL